MFSMHLKRTTWPNRSSTLLKLLVCLCVSFCALQSAAAEEKSLKELNQRLEMTKTKLKKIIPIHDKLKAKARAQGLSRKESEVYQRIRFQRVDLEKAQKELQEQVLKIQNAGAKNPKAKVGIPDAKPVGQKPGGRIIANAGGKKNEKNARCSRKVFFDEREDRILITVFLDLYPGRKVAKPQLEAFVAERQAEVEEIWNQNGDKLKFKTGPDKRAKPVTIRVVYHILENKQLRDGGNLVQVHPGKPKRGGRNADNSNYWLTNNSRTTAHEVGHVMGLDDEYSQKRTKTHHNLMGFGSSRRVLAYHIMQIVYQNHGNPSSLELKSRRSISGYFRKEQWRHEYHGANEAEWQKRIAKSEWTDTVKQQRQLLRANREMKLQRPAPQD